MKRNLLVVTSTLFICIILASPGLSSTISEPYNPETGKIVYQLSSGWNLVPCDVTMYRDGEHLNTCGDSIKAVYRYSPVQNQYLGAYMSGSKQISVPANAQEMIQNEKNSNFYHAMGFGGCWMYTMKTCSFESSFMPKSQYSTMKQSDMDKVTIKKGWNFIAILPFMLDHDISKLFENCNIVALNQWQDGDQRWMFSSSSDNAKNARISAIMEPLHIGYISVMKVTDDCHLNIDSGAIQPPPAPPG